VKLCKTDCYNDGYCNNGTCLCAPGYGGDNCAIELCLNDCSGRGICRNRTCYCEAGYYSEDCSLKKCPDCLNDGECDPMKG
jgi:syndecan 4